MHKLKRIEEAYHQMNEWVAEGENLHKNCSPEFTDDFKSLLAHHKDLFDKIRTDYNALVAKRRKQTTKKVLAGVGLAVVIVATGFLLLSFRRRNISN